MLLPILLMAQDFAEPSAATPDETVAAVSSRYTEFGGCAEIADGEETGQDLIAYRCKGLDSVPVWLTYADSARSYIGFGSRENLSGPFGLTRVASWPVEWRGVQRNGSFEPFAVIIRMQRPEAGVPSDGKGLLFVFRLRTDGLSCMVGSELPSNEKAREVADGSLDEFECLVEPVVPGSP